MLFLATGFALAGAGVSEAAPFWFPLLSPIGVIVAFVSSFAGATEPCEFDDETDFLDAYQDITLKETDELLVLKATLDELS